jgi:ADP-ribose pyrophosphatase
VANGPSRHTYTAANGTTRTWESSQRLTRPKGIEVDGVGIAAIIQPKNGGPPSILLQKQFRPPIDAVTIEVPAGLVDEGETPEECALRELKEETGYIGQIMDGGFGSTPLMFNGKLYPQDGRPKMSCGLTCITDPGFCNTNLHMIHCTIDLDNPANANPQPRLEDDEFIECFIVPLTNLYSECEKLEREGYAIDARVATLAEGIEIAKRFKIT